MKTILLLLAVIVLAIASLYFLETKQNSGKPLLPQFPEFEFKQELSINSAKASANKSTNYDGKEYYFLGLEVEYNLTKPSTWVNTSLDLETTDELGKKPSFYNEKNIISSNQEIVAFLKTGSFFANSILPLSSEYHDYTTKLTINDHSNNKSSSTTVKYGFGENKTE